jgi:hypothetical protein
MEPTESPLPPFSQKGGQTAPAGHPTNILTKNRATFSLLQIAKKGRGMRRPYIAYGAMIPRVAELPAGEGFTPSRGINGRV